MRATTTNSIRTIGQCVGLSAVLLVPLRPVTGQDLSLKREMLGEGIYVFEAPQALERWTATNAVVIINDGDVTVFDSNTRPSTARAVIAEIRKLTSKPVRTLINSHWHMDHWSGNDAYLSAFPDIQIIATTQTRDYMSRISPRFFEAEVESSLRRDRAGLDTAIRRGTHTDGSPLTAADRRALEVDIEQDARFAKEMGSVPRVLPNLTYRDTLVFWKGQREFRLFSETGDASSSTVLYLPKEKLLVTGDMLVSPEDGKGPPPWTTTSYSITPWLESLRSLDKLDIDAIVPGQGPAMHDKSYLTRTADLFASIIAQVHAALGHGPVTLAEVQGAVNADAIGVQYTPGAPAPAAGFHQWVAALTAKVYQESLDGLRDVAQ